MKHLILLTALLLSGCGAGGSSAPAPGYAVKMMVRLGHSGPVPAAPDFDASYVTPAQPLIPADDVAMQASFPGPVGLRIGQQKSADFSTLPAYLEAARAHQNVRWVYVYEELFWEDMQIRLGADEAPITAAARQVQAAGLKSAISIMPDVILHPAFRLADPGAFDLVVIHMYPDSRPPVAGCDPGTNPYTSLLACTVNALRAVGYTGAIGYAYEAFTNTSVLDLPTRLRQQQETIAAAPALGVSMLIAFGLYDETGTLGPPRAQGAGSPIEHLVDCSWGC